MTMSAGGAEPAHDQEYLLKQAERCRRLAAAILDKDTQKSLTQLAARYDGQIAALGGAGGT